MHTPSRVRRPPHEYASSLLEVTKGCSHNKCLFCSLYQGIPFAPVPMEHVEEDLDEIAATKRSPLRVLLVGGNPMGLPNKRLIPLLDMIKEKLPTVDEVGGYMRIDDIKQKSDEDLRAMAAARVTDVAIGTECGWDPALERMCKGHTAADIVEQCARLDAAGIGYSVFYLPGFAGAGLCHQSALTSAEVFSQISPLRITIMSMTPFPGCKLRDLIERGEFELACEAEVVDDVATFLENVQCETIIAGSHDTNFFRIDGLLPRDRDRLVATLRLREEQLGETGMKGVRMRMKSM